MPLTDKKTKFQLTLLECGVSEEASELAWQQDSWTEVAKIVRFSGGRCLPLPEVRGLLYAALDLPRGPYESWNHLGLSLIHI